MLNCRERLAEMANLKASVAALFEGSSRHVFSNDRPIQRWNDRQAGVELDCATRSAPAEHPSKSVIFLEEGSIFKRKIGRDVTSFLSCFRKQFLVSCCVCIERAPL